MGKTIQLVLIGILAFSVMHAQEAPSDTTAKAPEYIEKQYTLFFPVNVSKIVREYKGNGHTIETMVNDLNKTLELEGVIPDSLTVFASTSPEGSAALNERLAIERAGSTRALLVELFPQFKQENIQVTSRPNDWSGMILTLRRDGSFSFKDLILKLLTDPRIENKDVEIRRKYPQAYAAIRDAMFDNMRTASVKIRVIKTETNVDEFVVEPELAITSESPLNFGKDGGPGEITYTKNVEDETIPAVRTQAGWIEAITPAANMATFQVAPNRSKDPRSAIITVEAYGKSHDVVVNQAGTDPALLLGQTKMHFPAEGGKGVITFEKNIDDEMVPVVKSSSESVAVGQVTDSQVEITVAENTTTEDKASTVELDYYGKKYQVEVTQDGAKVLKPFYMGVKTNMLYDAAIIPNVGVEFYLGKNFSVVGNWMYSWWKSDKVAWYWRTYGGDLAVRYWFGKASKEKPLQGHHLGLYGQILTYDFEVGGRGYLGDKWTYGGGLEYGYSLPVARRLNIDFTLGVGYLGGEFKEYLPIDGHYVWQVTKMRHWMGPTKAEISLVWLLGRGNENEGKGGKR